MTKHFYQRSNLKESEFINENHKRAHDIAQYAVTYKRSKDFLFHITSKEF